MTTEQNNNFYDIIKQRSLYSPHKTILESPTYGAFTFSQLLKKIDNIRNFLAVHEVSRKDRILVVLPDNFELGLTFLGVASYCQCLPLNPALVSQELDHFITKLKPTAVVISSKDKNLPSDAFKNYKDLSLFDFSQLYNADTKGQIDAQDIFAPYDHDIALMLPTSGTTSTPKIVPLTHLNLCSSAQNIISSLSLSEDDRYLNIMPLFHIHGLMLMLSSLFVSSPIFCAPKFDKNKFFSWMEEFQPTWYSASPAIHQAIISESSKYRNVIKESKLRFIRSSAAPLPPQVADELEEVFRVPVVESYGMTEAALQITSNPLEMGRRLPGSAGKPAGPQVMAVDSQGNFVNNGKEGEVVIKGDNIMSGYLGGHSINNDYFIDDWLRTGDWGYLDKDNNLFIKSRIKEMINKGGENISPREVEEILLRHQDIDEAVVFSAPHPSLGEDVMAAVVIRKQSNITESDIKDYIMDYVSYFKIPSRIVFLEKIPKNAAGKISRSNFYSQIKSDIKKERSFSSTEIEDKILQVWQKVLKEDDIDVQDNFFEIGGDSMKMQEMINQLSKEGFNVTNREFLNVPTIQGLAKKIKNN